MLRPEIKELTISRLGTTSTLRVFRSPRMANAARRPNADAKPKTAMRLEEARQPVEDGLEHVTDLTGLKLLRKRK